MRMPRPYSALVLLAVLGACAAAGGPPPADMPPAPQLTRTLIERHDSSDAPGKEVILGKVSMPEGSVAGWHYHDGDEAGYVTQGTLVLHTRGRPDQVLHAGQTFFNPRGAVHSLTTVPGSGGGEEVSTWILDKDKPFATPVP